jgi:hypothetical protein
VLARQVVGRLSEVQRDVAGAFPEPEKLRGETVRDAEVVERLGTTFGETLEERRHALRISDGDGFGEEVGVL